MPTDGNGLVSADEAAALAREAIVFAYPMLFNYKTIWEQTQDPYSGGYIGGFNRYRHYTRSYTSADTDIVTPNNDSPYSWAWFDLRREPVILRAPAVAEDRYYVVQMFDLFTFNFAYVGVRATGFDGGDFLIAGPDWDGPMPDGISGVLRTETQLAGTLTRTALFGADDMPVVRAIQHGYQIQPLSEYAGLRPPPPVRDPVFPVWSEERALSAGFVGYLNFLLTLVQPHPSERELYARLAGIGIGAGRRWAPEAIPADVLAAIELGVKQGLADVDEKASHTTSSLGIFGSREQLGTDYLTRAVAAQMGIYGQIAEEAVYGGSRLDGRGAQLVGNTDYTLHFDKAESQTRGSSGRSRCTSCRADCSPPIRSAATRSATGRRASPTRATGRSTSPSAQPSRTIPRSARTGSQHLPTSRSRSSTGCTGQVRRLSTAPGSCHLSRQRDADLEVGVLRRISEQYSLDEQVSRNVLGTSTAEVPSRYLGICNPRRKRGNPRG